MEPDPEIKKLWEEIQRELRPDKDRRSSPRPNPPVKPPPTRDGPLLEV